MQVSGKDLRYTLYVEGVLIPISSLSVRIPSGGSATLSVDILPIPEGLMITKAMRAHLFKKVNTAEPILKFNGMVTNKVYVKSGAHRALRLEISSIDSRWDTMVMLEFNERHMSSGTVSSRAVNKEAIAEGIANGTIPSDSPLVAAAARGDNHVPATMGPLLGGNSVYASMIDSGQAGSNKPSVAPDVKVKVINGATVTELAPTASLVGIFEQNILASNGNVVNGLISTLKSVYNSSNQYNQMEMKWNRIEEAIYAMPCLNGSHFLSKFSSNPDTPKASLSAAMGALMRSILSDTRAGVPVRHAITQILDSLFFKVSVDPTKIEKSVCFHPLTVGYIPPKCNVIFPNMYDGLSLNFNSWVEPTRSIVGLSPYVAENGQALAADSRLGSTVSINVAPAADPHLAFAKRMFVYSFDETLGASENRVQEANILEDQRRKSLAISTLTKEETLVGVTANIVNIANPMFSSISEVDSAMVADFVHSLSRCSVRMCNVRGELLDDMVCGMPVLILDSDFSIHGTLEEVSYNVDDSGSVSSNLIVGYPKMIMNEDTLPTPPLWLSSDDTSDSNISKTYNFMFGCGSIYDDMEVVSKGGRGLNITSLAKDNPTGALRAVISELHRRYDAEVNKRVFVEKFRARPQLSLYDVFKGVYKATPVKRSKSASDKEVTDVLNWEGKEFGAYSGIGNTGGALPDHAPVDKPERVKAYINAYGQRKGILAR